MGVSMFDHYTVRAADMAASVRFYHEVMDLRPQLLDGFEFPMTLMFLGEQAIVHILQTGPGLDRFLGRHAPAPRTHGSGNMEHVAFNATGLAEFRARLAGRGVAVVERALADYGVYQLMFDDPDGIEIEVNFPLAERG